MKKKLCIALLVLALLSGCASAEPPGESPTGGTSAPTQSGTAFAAQSASSIQASQTGSFSRELTEEEVLTAYKRAITAYEWFDLEALPCSGPAVLVDGANYYRVEYPGFKTLEDLESYLHSLFSEELIARLLPQGEELPQYRDIDGVLYTQLKSREPDPTKDSFTAAVERKDEETYLINVMVDLLDDDLSTVTGVECFSFPYQQVGGRWVFTEFELVE